MTIHEAIEDITLQMTEVTTIVPIGAGFWKRIDGSLDLGFSYTRSSHIAQSTVSSNTVYRVQAFETRVTGSATLTKSEDEGTRDDRATVQASYLRFRGPRLFVGAGGGFESNKPRPDTAVAAGGRRGARLVIPTVRRWHQRWPLREQRADVDAGATKT